MDLSVNFNFFLNFLNLYSNPYPNIKLFFCILNYLIRNLQEICKIPEPKPKYSKNRKLNLKPLGFIGCIWHYSKIRVIGNVVDSITEPRKKNNYFL